MPVSQRGIDARLQKSWAHAIEKEDKLRLNWFRNNEERLNNIANKPPSRSVPEEMKTEFKRNLKENFQAVEKLHRLKSVDPEPLDPRALQGIMKPVDPATTRLIYTGTNKDGRLNYLHERIRLFPDQRYYFPELSSFVYGWKMWNRVKDKKTTGFGRQQVIKESFYRRRGVSIDPEWYKEPAVFSPSVCSCN